MDKQTTNFEIVPRRSLIVWVYSLRHLRALRRFGIISHVSRKLKYVVIYMDESRVEQNIKGLEKMHFVREVEKSYRPDVLTDFAQKIGKPLMEEGPYQIEEVTREIKLVKD